MNKNLFTVACREELFALPHVREFSSYLRFERNFSINTHDAYIRAVSAWFHFCTANGVVFNHHSFDDATAFIIMLNDEGLKPATLHLYIEGVKAFYAYLEEMGVCRHLPVLALESRAVARELPNILTAEEVSELLAAIDQSTIEGVRDFALISLLYASGVRVSEVCSLRMRDICLEESYFRVQGKGRKERFAFFDPTTAEALQAWMEVRAHLPLGPEEDEFLFVSYRRLAHLSRITVYHIVTELAKACGLNKKISPHTFRHSFATAMLQGGANMFQVQALLGHSSVATTQFYVHLDTSHLQRTIDACHPRNIRYRQQQRAI